MKASKKKTSFGEMLKVAFDGGEAEMMTFRSKGRPHVHDTLETALLLSGSGTVRVGDQDFEVKAAGDEVSIPPGIPHFMIPDETMTMLIYYTDKRRLKHCVTRMA